MAPLRHRRRGTALPPVTAVHNGSGDDDLSGSEPLRASPFSFVFDTTSLMQDLLR
jgi:hypothetical protein